MTFRAIQIGNDIEVSGHYCKAYIPELAMDSPISD